MGVNVRGCGRVGFTATASLLALLATSVALPQVAVAQSASTDGRVEIDIPAQDLNKALLTLANRTGLEIVYDLEKVAGRRNVAVRGSYSPMEALSLLLGGSGLTYRAEGGNRLRLEPVPEQADGTVQLGTLRVEGASGGAGNGTSGADSRGTASSNADTVYTRPISTVHISGEQLDRYGRSSVADILRGQAGVQLGDGRNGGGLDVNIRGIQGQSRVAVTVDGSQQALDIYRGYAGTQQRSYIDPDLISEATVSKGPQIDASTGGAIGGTVALTTLRADDIVRDGKSFGIRLKGEAWDNGVEPAARSHVPGQNLSAMPRVDRGSLSTSAAEAGSIAAALKQDAFDLVAAYARRNQGNYFAGNKGYDRYRMFDARGREENSTAKSFKQGEEVLNSSSETESLLLKANVRPAEGHDVELSYRYFDGAFGEIMPSDIFRLGTAGVYQYPQSKIRIHSASLRYAFKPVSNDLIDLKANLWWTDARTDMLTAVLAPTSERFSSDRNWTRLDNRRIGGDLSNTSTVSSGIGTFAVTLGAAFQHEDLRPQKRVVVSEHDINMNRVPRNGYRKEFNLSARLNYNPTDSLQLWAGGRFSDFQAHDRNALSSAIRKDLPGRWVTVSGKGGWGNMFWQPDANGNYTAATDPRLNNGIVIANTNNPFEGIRFNDFGATSVTVSAPGVYATVIGFKRAKKLSSRDSGFSPALGVNYQVTPDILLYASYTQALRMPSLFETTLGTLQVTPVTGVKPERSRALEIGASALKEDFLKSGDKASIKLAYFNNNIKNYITRYYDPSGNGGMTFSNADSYKASGIEFQSSYDAGGVYVDLSATHYIKTQTCDAAFAARLRAAANQYTKTQDTPDCTPGSYMGSYTNTQNPPEYAVNLNAGARFFDRKLTIGGRMVYTSGPTEKLDKPWQTGATTPQLIYHPVTLFDAFLRFAPVEQLTVNASIQNIGDRYYLDPLAQSFMPSPGRTFRLGVTLNY